MDLLDLSSRVPFIIRAPWIEASVGVKVSTVIELVDVYRTAADLAGIRVTTTAEHTSGYYGLAGRSLIPLLKRQETALAEKRLAFTQHPRCNTKHDFPRYWPGGPFVLASGKPQVYSHEFVCMRTPREHFRAMGYAGGYKGHPRYHRLSVDHQPRHPRCRCALTQICICGSPIQHAPVHRVA